MLTEINLIGFKSFLSRELNLNKLTVLTGLNNSGKSSIIQALLIMEKAFNAEKNILLNYWLQQQFQLLLEQFQGGLGGVDSPDLLDDIDTVIEF